MGPRVQLICILTCVALLPWSGVIAAQAGLGDLCHCQMPGGGCSMSSCARSPAEESAGDAKEHPHVGAGEAHHAEHRDDPEACERHVPTPDDAAKLRCGKEERIDVGFPLDAPRLTAGAPINERSESTQAAFADFSQDPRWPAYSPASPPPRKAPAAV